MLDKENNFQEDLISIVIPVYNEGINLSRNIHEILKSLTEINNAYEIILIDDGSTDQTWSEIVKLSESVSSIFGIKFSRNFGKEAAMFAGLTQSVGAAVIVMDSDLEHPPGLLVEMVDKWKQENYLIVEGVKNTRSDKGALYLAVAKVYNTLFKKISGIDLSNSSDYKLIDREVVIDLLRMGEVNTFFRGMVAWTGYSKTVISFDVPKRNGDKSKFSVFTLTRLAVKSLVSFSSAPLQLITSIGIIFLIISIIGTIQTLWRYFFDDVLEGFTTVIVLIFFTGSVLMLALGIIGTYLAKIYEEIKNRPRYIIENQIKSK